MLKKMYNVATNQQPGLGTSLVSLVRHASYQSPVGLWSNWGRGRDENSAVKRMGYHYAVG